jgi:hypothetical protein
MNTKSISIVICLALMSVISVSTAHAMYGDSEGPQRTPSVFEPFSNACKRFAVTAVSDGASSFMFTSVGLYVTKGIHLLSRSQPHLMPISYCILAHGAITGFINVYRHQGANYTKKDMQADIALHSMFSLYSASMYVTIVNLFYAFCRLAPSHLR